MSRLDADAEVVDQDGNVWGCQWYALCDNPANGLRDHPVIGDVPICQRCDDKTERLGA